MVFRKRFDRRIELFVNTNSVTDKIVELTKDENFSLGFKNSTYERRWIENGEEVEWRR